MATDTEKLHKLGKRVEAVETMLLGDEPDLDVAVALLRLGLLEVGLSPLEPLFGPRLTPPEG